MVILDTDHMSVLERREQPGLGTLLMRLAELPPADVVTTVISSDFSQIPDLHVEDWTS